MLPAITWELSSRAETLRFAHNITLMTPAEIATIITASGAVIAASWAAISWTLNLREKRRVDEYVRKEQVYRDIVKELQSLYRSDNPHEKEKFIEQTRVTWIYCPDAVVRELNASLDALIEIPAPPNPQKVALGRAVAAMRKDLMPETELTDDFRHVSAGVSPTKS